MDPSTLLYTGYFAQNLDEEPRLPHYEYALADFNKWAWLARSGRSVGVLSEATNGDLELSPRWRELMRPRGIQHELRMTFTDSGNAWGVGGMYRGAARPDFDADEVSLIRALSPLIAEGMRRAVLTTAKSSSDSIQGPGVVVVDRNGELESVSESAAVMLADVMEQGDLGQGKGRLMITTVAELARRDGGPDGVPARARALTLSGHWLVLHASRLAGGDADRIAVVIEPARPHEIAPLLLAAYRLTKRERDVVGLCLAGASTEEIAARLYISSYTVQDHLKVVFEKVGVRSRRELVSRIFNDHVLPHIVANDAFTPATGWVSLAEPVSAIRQT